MSAAPASDEVAVVIPARNEADRIQATVTAALGLPAAAVVIVVDDGSKDGTADAARSAGAVVTRHTRNRGKGAAMETGAEAVALLDQRERRDRPRHLLFLDADLGGTAAAARSAGAVVTRHARNRGKGAAMETGAEAVALLDQRERRDRPRNLLFLDADLGRTAAAAGPL
ncbi:MAG TPA: glycosyltransferase, partial [Streptosporangiaceae bacterium]|nr:glycosyltransferase [Streptosporangiaceae bacterium]